VPSVSPSETIKTSRKTDAGSNIRLTYFLHDTLATPEVDVFRSL
jgi:hypothetical protein